MIEIQYELRLKTPTHVGAGYGFAGFLDSVVMRDGSGLIYIPGSSIKGKARATARRLADGLQGTSANLCDKAANCLLHEGKPCIVCRLFGSPQFPGTLYFDNIVLPDLYQKILRFMHKHKKPLLARQAMTQKRTHVMLSRRRRAALPDHLFTNELIRADLPLKGAVRGHLPHSQKAQTVKRDLALLRGALGLITHIGRARSRGLGYCDIHVVSFMIDGQSFTNAEYEQALQQLGEEA